MRRLPLDLVYREQVRVNLPCRSLVVRAVRAVWPYLKVPPGTTAELAVTLVGPARMRSLNRRWRKTDRPTDVLAFPLQQPKIAGYTAVSLGDLFVCPAVVRAKAEAGGTPERAQFTWTLVHGLLHLAGYDHERGPRAAARMAALERRLLNTLSVRS
jgi:rRNA maturation RNase YbeY